MSVAAARNTDLRAKQAIAAHTLSVLVARARRAMAWPTSVLFISLLVLESALVGVHCSCRVHKQASILVPGMI